MRDGQRFFLPDQGIEQRLSTEDVWAKLAAEQEKKGELMMKTKNVQGTTGAGIKVRAMAAITIGLCFILSTVVAKSQGAAVSRPISDFVSAQGTFCLSDGMGGCILFVPPVKNFVGWEVPGSTRIAAVDYAGLANSWIEGASGGSVSFGTTTDGTIVERPMDDGRADVTLVLHTHNALTWVGDSPTGDFATATLLFGVRAPDVLAGAQPALGDSVLSLHFINTAPGAPMPDLLPLIFLPEPGQELDFLHFNSQAVGSLHAAFGVAEGTPGHAQITQNALFGAAIHNGFKGALADGAPVEHIDLSVVGK